jgi:hypothetical protein
MMPKQKIHLIELKLTRSNKKLLELQLLLSRLEAQTQTLVRRIEMYKLKNSPIKTD